MTPLEFSTLRTLRASGTIGQNWERKNLAVVISDIITLGLVFTAPISSPVPLRLSSVASHSASGQSADKLERPGV